MVGGDTVGWRVDGVPTGSIAGALLLDLTPSTPGLSVPILLPPTCMLSTSPMAIVFGVDPFPAATQITTASLPIPHGYEGLDVYAQYITLSPTGGHINAMSNAIHHTVGLR